MGRVTLANKRRKKGNVFRMIFARGMNESPLDSDCDTSSSEGEYNVIICLLYLFTLSLHYLNSFLTFDVLSFSVTSQVLEVGLYPVPRHLFRV